MSLIRENIFSDQLSQQQSWRALRFLTLYRLTLAGLILVLFASGFVSGVVELGYTSHFLYITIAYLCFSLFVGFSTRLQWVPYVTQVYGQLFSDFIFLALIILFSGGVKGSFSALMIVAVAAGSILVPGRVVFLFAAVATIMTFSQELFGYIYQIIKEPALNQAGLLGAAFFVTAFMAYVLARRIRETEAIALQRGVDLANMEELNEYIIRRMQSGIIVIDDEQTVRMMNAAAAHMLEISDISKGAPIRELSPQIAVQLECWKSDPRWDPPLLKVGSGTQEVAPRFIEIGHGDKSSGVLIFLEDATRVKQQAQQMKLASLGALAGGIAHEVRNPLGAISHAGQLLAESDNLDKHDVRLTEIIRDHSQRVNRIIENVLRLSRGESSKPEWLNLGEWLNGFLEDFEQSHNLDGVTIEKNFSGAGACSIYFDAANLYQVLTNLLENAIKYGKSEDGSVLVQINTGCSEGSASSFLEVIDHGIGLSVEKADQIFEPFFTTSTTGTGLGLYISSELCSRDRARLSYEPAVQGGSCFRITFANPEKINE